MTADRANPFLAVPLLALLLVIVGGCGAATETAPASSTLPVAGETSSTVQAGAATTETSIAESTYDSVETMRQAFEAAGHRCSTWSIRPSPRYGTEAADCRDETLFIIYADTAAAMAHVEATAETINVALGRDASFLIGTNWAVHCGYVEGAITCEELRAALGGGIVEFAAAE